MSLKKKVFLISKLIAHRGIHSVFLENTIPAIRRAMEENYIIELDVHLSRDNVVVVFHDNNLKRVFGINQEIKKLTLKEIKQISSIPTLEEVLDLVRGRVPILIEFKFDTKAGCLERAACKLLDHYSGEFAVQSFSPLSVFWFLLNRPSYVRGYLVNGGFPDNFLLRFFLNRNLLKRVLKPDFIGVNKKSLKEKRVQKLRKKYFIIGYTLNTKKEYQEYCPYADNFISDIPLK